MFKFRFAFACCLLLPGIIAPCLARNVIDLEVNQSLQQVKMIETGLLQNLAGYKDAVLGAHVISITAGEDGVSEVIEICMPVGQEQADRILVVSGSGKPLKLLTPMQISHDHESKKVGMILALPGETKQGFKIRLIDLPDE